MNAHTFTAILRRPLAALALAASFAPLSTTASVPLPGQTLMTCFSGGAGTSVAPDSLPGGFVLGTIDTRPAPLAGAPLGDNWSTAPMSHGPTANWTNANLGEVFGVTLDSSAAPNIFLSATSIYWRPATSSYNMPHGYGAVVRLDSTTGAISTISLPNGLNSAGIGPGLGNLCHAEIATKNWLYVSNFEDGKIYKVQANPLLNTGTTFDHGMVGPPTLTPAKPALPDDAVAGRMTQLGRRVWGVRVHLGRLYYGVWRSNWSTPNGDRNEIWSLALDPANGDFLPATVRRELELPLYRTEAWAAAPSCIDFDPAGNLFVAERYTGDGFVGARRIRHGARVLKFMAPTWTAAPQTFFIGDFFDPALGTINGSNSAGGVGIACDGSVWATGDFWKSGASNAAGNTKYLYGLEHVPAAGNATPPHYTNVHYIDADGNTTAGDKTFIGSCHHFRVCDCLDLIAARIECPRTTGGGFPYTATVKNNTPYPISWMTFVPISGGITSISPQAINFPVNLAPGATTTINVTLQGPAGASVCLKALLQDNKQRLIPECCIQSFCVDLPKCCFTLLDHKTECLSLDRSGRATLRVTLSIRNDSGVPITSLQTPSGTVTLTPPLAPGATRTVTFLVNGAPPAGPYTMMLGLRNGNALVCQDPITLSYACRVLGRCKLTPTVYCSRTSLSAITTLTICNTNVLPTAFSWNVVASNPSCLPLSAFTPGTGTTPVIPAGGCISIPISINCRSLAASSCGYCVDVRPVNGGRTFTCCGQVVRRGIIFVGPATPIGVGTTTASGLTNVTVTNDSDVPQNIMLGVRPLSPEISVVIVDPASPALALAPGESRVISIRVSSSNLPVGTAAGSVDDAAPELRDLNLYGFEITMDGGDATATAPPTLPDGQVDQTLAMLAQPVDANGVPTPPAPVQPVVKPLDIALAPQDITAGTLQLDFTPREGLSYQIQCSTNLKGPWQTIPFSFLPDRSLPTDGAQAQETLPTQLYVEKLGLEPRRFYRIVAE